MQVCSLMLHIRKQAYASSWRPNIIALGLTGITEAEVYSEAGQMSAWRKCDVTECCWRSDLLDRFWIASV